MTYPEAFTLILASGLLAVSLRHLVAAYRRSP